jgi:hypothetical protein
MFDRSARVDDVQELKITMRNTNNENLNFTKKCSEPWKYP